jgi:hypothetical protein
MECPPWFTDLCAQAHEFLPCFWLLAPIISNTSTRTSNDGLGSKFEDLLIHLKASSLA